MELYHSFKDNWMLYILKIILASILLVFLYTSFSYYIVSQSIKNGHFQQREDEMITIIDTLFEASDFENYSHSEENLNKIAVFYNLLNNEEIFKYTTIFDQPISIKNFSNAPEFIYDSNYDGFIDENESTYIENSIPFTDLKSIQLNQKTLEYYNLIDDADLSFSFDNLDIFDRQYPVLLGNNYSKIYKVGDVIEGNYYSRNFNFRVAGFLKEGAAVFYQNNINTYLDDYIILPYPNEIKPVLKENFDFERIFLFSTINGSIIYQNNPNIVINRINQLSKDSGFDSYTFIGIPSFYTQNSNLRDALNQNRILILSISIICTMFVTFLCIYINHIIYKKRREVYIIYYLTGCNALKLRKLFVKDGFLDCLLLPFFVGIFIYSQNTINIKGILFLLALFLFWIVINIISYLFQFRENYA